jgi:selenocysteine lyase/cysteine desulfurase
MTFLTSMERQRLNNITVERSINALEDWFDSFRRNIIGNRQTFASPFGRKEIIYADWTASGRGFGPIEECLQNSILPFVGNTHTGTTITGTMMSEAYAEAKGIVKEHVGAGGEDVLIFCGSGMTGAVNKLQRILGWRGAEEIADEDLRPVVFVTHMEHHSNQVSWLETIATVCIIRPDEEGNVDLYHFRTLLEQFKHRKIKVAAVTACSNVTGIQTPYQEIAKIIHEYGGLCFVDFACSAPYVNIDMHPGMVGAELDAIYFSPHKFLGGPGTPGVLIFHKRIYKKLVPDQPGGGTVVYSNPWGGHEYVKDIEQREDGGTPPFLGGIKVAMCVRLKERMGVENMARREEEMIQVVLRRLSGVKNIEIMEGRATKRLGVISFIVLGAHYNLIVKLLNDRFGIQTRGGCSCAGTYGHRLLKVDKDRSLAILDSIRAGDWLGKPGWVRVSVHPTMTDKEIDFIMDAIEMTAGHFEEWGSEYEYNAESNEFAFTGLESKKDGMIEDWFEVDSWGKLPD